MGKQKWRRMCKGALTEAGYTDLNLFFERNGRQYTSYWGCGVGRAEVILDKKTGMVCIYELNFVK